MPPYGSQPHPAAVQLLQAPVNPLLHVQPPLQLPPVVLDGDTRVSFLQAPGAAPRAASPRWRLQLAQHPLAQPLSCHSGPRPGPRAALCASAGAQGASYGPGRSRPGAGAWARPGASSAPVARASVSPPAARGLVAAPPKARSRVQSRCARGPGVPGWARTAGAPGAWIPGGGVPGQALGDRACLRPLTAVRDSAGARVQPFSPREDSARVLTVHLVVLSFIRSFMQPSAVSTLTYSLTLFNKYVLV